MADKLTMEFIDYANIKASYPFYNRFPLMKELYSRGKSPILLHVDLAIDTSTTTTLTETGAPTNEIINFASPMQVYLRSDDAGDTSKKIDVIGQKADDSFGQFTLTSNAADGTTPVDIGTWKFISFVIKNDAWAGNVILDDDGASSTVYFTAPLGATSTTGIFVVPDGYHGGCIDGGAKALVVITTVNEMAFVVDHVFSATLNLYNPITRFHNPSLIHEGKTNIRTAFHTAAFATKAHFLVAIWK